MKSVLVLGAGGFIGSHLVKKLKSEECYVVGVDLKYPEFSPSPADVFVIGDLRDPMLVSKVFSSPFQTSELDVLNSFDEVYQLAADMGGAGYIFTGMHDANVMHNSALINLNVAKESHKKRIKKLFFSSSACMYPQENQTDPNNPNCEESSAYPAHPDSEYGWEKLFSERLYLSFARNYGLDVRIARLHNIFGPEGSWNNGKEKAPAAMCRKVAVAGVGDSIEIWGDGKQTRSFLYIDECLKAIEYLMDASAIFEPLNIGSDEMVTIDELAEKIMMVAGKNFKIKHIDGPLGVRGRCSDNKLIQEKLGWSPSYSLLKGLGITYAWINKQVNGR